MFGLTRSACVAGLVLFFSGFCPALANEPMPKKAPVNTVEVDTGVQGFSSFEKHEPSGPYIQGKATFPVGKSNVSVKGGYGEIGSQGVGSARVEATPVHAETAPIADLGVDCSVQNCNVGARVGARMNLGNGTSLDLLTRPPVFGTVLFDRTRDDASSLVLASAYVGIEKNIPQVMRFKAYLEANLLHGPDMMINGRTPSLTSAHHTGIGSYLQAGIEADAYLTKHIAITVAAAAEAKHYSLKDPAVVLGDNTTSVSNVGITGKGGLKVAF